MNNWKRPVALVSVAAGLLIQMPMNAEAVTWTREATNTYRNAFGVTLMRHTAIVQWSGNGNGTLYSSPRALNNATYQITGITRTGVGAEWDWYSARSGGTGQAVNTADWLIGIPTPWGGIGTTHHSLIINQVNGYGGMGRIR